MATKERRQSPVLGDDLILRLFTFNSNNATNVHSIKEVEIFFLDPSEKTESNPDGRRLVTTVDGVDVDLDEEGQYSITVALDSPTFTIGAYKDIWNTAFEESDDLENRITTIENDFDVFPDLWYTSDTPITHDFSFRFSPSKIRKGSKKFLTVEIIPNVPRASDVARFYENLAIVSDLAISMELACGECVPQEKDLRLVFDCAPVDFRETCFGFFSLDTRELDCGVYNVWFTLEFGGNIFVSENQQLQIFD
jgi:hypothetical protein